MPVSNVWLRLDESGLAEVLHKAAENVNDAGHEAVLDFSSVRRVDVSALKALEELADVADQKSVKVSLQGVNVDIYKVLKLMKLAPRFSFLH